MTGEPDDGGAPAVTVVIPTHDHAATLGYAARSVLGQTWRDLALVILGDGVDDATRVVARTLVEEDPRVRFLDLPKGAHHGEEHRHRLMGEIASSVVSWLGDDDLAFPDHVEEILRVLGDGDFAHPLPILVGGDGALTYLPADMADPRWHAWHRADPPRNAISLTGATYTRAAYARLTHGWEPPPAGVWSDLHLWRAFLALPDLRAATGTRATTVKLVGEHRRGWTEAERAAEIATWAERIASPAFRDDWDAQVADAVRRMADARSLQLTEALAAEVQARSAQVEATREAAARERAALARAEAAEAELARIRRSRSWRWTLPLRAAGRGVRALLGRRVLW